MKKRKVLIICIGVSLIFLFSSGCASKYIYNKSTPEEEMCRLNFSDNYSITKFDEEKVKWKPVWRDEAFVKIPAGEHTLTVNYYRYDIVGNLKYIRTANDIKITYSFQSGKTYRIFSIIYLDKIYLSINEDDMTDND